MTTMHQSYLPDPGTVLSRRYAAVDQVHEILLNAIRVGKLGAGDALHDQTWATGLKISRTPIREAFKRLENHGIVSIAAARFTRIVHFTAEQARQEARDWAVIHLALLGALGSTVDPKLIADLEALHGRVRDEESMHGGFFAFFERLRAASTSFGLQLGATAVAYRFRLADSDLSEHSNADRELCAELVAGLKSNTPEALSPAFARWANAVTQA